jgi:hypothetical protein
MSIVNNGIILKHLFQLEAEEDQNERIERALDLSIKSLKFIDDNKVEIKFYNGLDVAIGGEFDSFKMYISDPSFYDNGENFRTNMGSDRVFYYLKRLAFYKFKINRNEDETQ